MKKHLFLKSLLVLIGILIGSVSTQMWAGYLYLKPQGTDNSDGNWLRGNERFAAYFYGDTGNSWRDMNKVQDGLYIVEIPATNATNVIFCRMNGSTDTNNWDNKWDQTGNLTVSENVGKAYKAGLSTWSWDASAIPVYTDEQTLYLLTNSDWRNDNARFAVCFGDGEATWVSMSRVGSTDYYSVTVPNDHCSYAIFCRMNGANNTNNWSNKWNQTSNMEPTSGKNGVEITASGDNNQSWIVVYTGLSVARNNNSYAAAPSIDQTLIKSGSSVSISAGNATTGYHWVNWTSSNGSFGTATNKSTTFTPTANSAVATANYSINQRYVRFNANGGSGSMSAQTFTYGIAQNLTANSFYKTGYGFAGWATASDGDVVYANSYNLTLNPTEAEHGTYLDLYAKWTASTYDVTLDPDEGSSTKTVVATYDAAMPSKYKNSETSVAAPSFDGYTFQGYYDNHAGAGTQYYTSTPASARTWNKASTATLYAKWTQTVTLDKNTNAAGATSGSAGVTYKKSGKTSFSAASRTGYTCTGYYTAASSGYKVIAADGTMQSTNANISSYIGASDKWVHSGATTLYAYWSANNYTVTLKPNGATSGSDQTVSATYDASMPGTTTSSTAVVAPTKTGYAFTGFWDNSTNGSGTKYYNADLSSAHNWDKANAANLWAQWSANSYTVTLSQSGETGYGSAGTGSVLARYDAAMPAIASLPTPATGYKFQGYFTESNGGGTQFTDATGAWQPVADYVEDGKWVNAGTLELFAFFEKAELTSFEYSPSTVAPGHNMEITPVISPTPHGTTCVCWTLFYDSECSEEVPGANYTITSSPSSGASSIILKAPTASGTYYLQGTLRTGSVCNAGDVLSTHKQACIVESDHKLTIRYICDNEVIRESRSIVVPAGDSVGVKAATIDGYTFSEWVLADVLQQADDDATGDSITIKARYDGTLTAKYIETPRVYFYNNLGWEDVYVTYDAYWDESNGTGNSGRPYHHMTHIEGTNIWYDNVPSAYTSSAFAGWASNIAFNDTELLNGGKQAPQESGDYGNYNRGNVIFRRDFDPYNTMFVPATSDIDVPFTKNEGTATYYSSGISTYVDEWYEDEVKKTYTHYFEQGGYWKKYQKTYSGYSLRGTFGGIVEGDSNWNGSEHDLYASNTEDSVFTTSIDLNGNWDYYFSIYKNTLKNNESAKFTYNTATLTINTTHTDIRFLSGRNDWRDISGDAADGNSKHCKLTTATAGVYTFYVKYKKNGTLEVSVEYPDAPGNFQVLYSDNTTSEWFKSDVIESDAQDAKVSFFYRPSDTPVLKWKKSTAIANDGTITWGSDHTFDMSDFSSVLNHDSVYVFYLSNVDNNLRMDSVKAYTGEYYIRTNCASKYKWDRYKDADHRMSYSEYSEKNSDYTHYFMKYAGSGTDVRFVVANEYSPAISDTLVQMDGDVSADPEYTHVSSSGSLAENANIRFMWNSHTNTVLRAYLAAAKDDGTQFLVMQGQNGKLYDENGNDLKNASNKGDAGYNHKAPDDAIQFSDIENWVYEANVKAKPGTFIKLYAQYDDGYFYFKGKNNATFDADNAFTLLGGSGDKKMDVRVVYDFKTDRLMAAYVPTAAAVTDTIAINADIMFIRQHQEAPTAITFGESSGKLDEVKTVYGVIRLNRWQISNRQHPEDDNVDHCKDQDSINKYHPLVGVGDMTSEYERSFYFISFPFDVNLSEVIGFGTYGVHWGIMYYDGKGRAKNGYWADSEVNWKYFTLEEMRTKKLKAFEGYVIGIDPALMYYTNTNIWTNNCSNLEIYFPSQTTIGAISKKAVTVTIDQDGYECKIDRRTDAEKAAGLKDINKNRTIADSYWHCIGVPTYADLTASIANVVSDTLERLEWGNKNLLYVYSWSKIDNSLTAVSAPTFEFETMKSYLVQYAGETISWAAASAGPQSIVARQREEEEIHFAEFNLAILQNEEKQDQTFVRLSDDENITNDFDFNYDLGKSFNAGKANIYTLAEGYIQAAANCLPLSSQTTIVPVGVKIAKEGDYTFSIPEGTNGVGVTLIDNETGIRTSLSALDYTINLSAGTYNDRFVLEISPIQQMPTGVELLNGENGENGVRKVLIDGLLYIVKDGVIYDAQGKRLQ